VNPLESRKQLLIAESECDRAQFLQEGRTLAEGVHGLAGRAKSFGSIASSAALLVAGLAALRRGKSVAADVKPTWLQTILKAASLVSTIWLAFRSHGHYHENK
jgi:hypothetical protein